MVNDAKPGPLNFNIVTLGERDQLRDIIEKANKAVVRLGQARNQYLQLEDDLRREIALLDRAEGEVGARILAQHGIDPRSKEAHRVNLETCRIEVQRAGKWAPVAR